ncbi:MAG TPA: sulfatase-like hydrolase/transferase [Anaerolineales bacterium]|nr:sulfatase-like hydrolase/transferase [Anaerolineales bacterium]
MQTALEKTQARRSFIQGLFAPLLLAIQPILHLFLINDTEVYFSEVIRSMAVSLLLGAVVLVLIYLLIHDWLKASVIASLFIFLSFLFGDVSDWITATFGLGPARADLLTLALMTACLTLWIWLVQKKISNIASVNLYFNLLGALFLLYYGIPVGSHLFKSGVSVREEQPQPVVTVESSQLRPDIYYIILDGYGREDILQALYDFDNSDFVEALKVRGFYVADEATSNYVQTLLSLSSSLNMDYLQSLQANGTTLESRDALAALVERSKVRSILAQNGYQSVSFRNAYNATIPSAEIYYDDTGFAYPVTAFESIVIDRTLARVLLHVPFFNKVLIEMPYDIHRSQILSTFERLREIPEMDGDYFVYAHIIAPHPPFVFDANGQAQPHREPFRLADGNNYIKSHSRESYIAGYRDQIQYVNELVLDTVDAILAESETPPIIILQGDHGPGSHLHQGMLKKTLPAERFSILNAYYFPDQEYASLYPSISPVNSFRVVLGQFFGNPEATLPDRHYYSTWGEPFDFVEVTDLSLP